MKIKNTILSGLLLTFIAGISNADAKLSSNIIKDQQPNINNVITKCQFKDTKVLDQIKGLSIGAAVTSGIATAGSITSTATSAVAAHKAKGVLDKTGNLDVKSVDDRKKAETTNQNLKNLRLASLIGSGVATGANLTTLGLSATSTKKLKSLIEESDECMKAIEEVNLEAAK